MASTITDFIKLIRHEAEQLGSKKVDTRPPFTSLLVDAIRDTIEEIKLGADSDSFRELVMLDFLLRADRAGYSTAEISGFVAELTESNELNYEDAKEEDFSEL